MGSSAILQACHKGQGFLTFYLCLTVQNYFQNKHAMSKLESITLYQLLILGVSDLSANCFTLDYRQTVLAAVNVVLKSYSALSHQNLSL